jgi:hypothetical protein
MTPPDFAHFPPTADGPRPADVLIGITTRNRGEIVARAAFSLGQAERIGEARLLVIDDASTEYGIDFLRGLYPPGTEFTRRETPSGSASFAARYLMETFLQREEAVLLCLDSDLVVAPDFLLRACAELPRTEGLLSLFHAHSHPGVEQDGLLLKKSVGFAGTVWTRALAREVMAVVPASDQLDWDVCRYLERVNRRIYCLPHSAVQHIGLTFGQFSSFVHADHGLSFRDNSWYNLSAQADVIMAGCRDEMKRLAAAQEMQKQRMEDIVALLGQKTALLEKSVALYQGVEQPTPGHRATLRERFCLFLARLSFALVRLAQSRRDRAGTVDET